MFICFLCVLETGKKTLKLKYKNTHFPCKDFPDFTRQMFERKFRKVANGDILGDQINI